MTSTSTNPDSVASPRARPAWRIALICLGAAGIAYAGWVWHRTGHSMPMVWAGIAMVFAAGDMGLPGRRRWIGIAACVLGLANVVFQGWSFTHPMLGVRNAGAKTVTLRLDGELHVIRPGHTSHIRHALGTSLEVVADDLPAGAPPELVLDRTETGLSAEVNADDPAHVVIEYR